MVDFLKRLFGKPPGEDEPALTLARSVEDLRHKTQAHDGTWGIGSAAWSVDLQAGLISFQTDRVGGAEVTAPVQVIGTMNTEDGTWLWRWDHPSVPEALAADARTARAFGERYGLERFTTRKLACTEEEAWQFTAVACYLAGAQGGYRGPTGPTLVFMTFGAVSMRRAG